MNPQNIFRLTAAIVFVAGLSRLLPHPANFTPIVATCLFGAAYLPNRKTALMLPLIALFLGDLFLQAAYWLGWREYAGFHAYMPFVYGGFAAVVGIGRLLKHNVKAWNVMLSALAGSLLFFVVSNLGVWLLDFPLTWAGFLQCFSQAVPFYRDNLTWLGDLLYTSALFGAFEWFVYRRPQPSTAKTF